MERYDPDGRRDDSFRAEEIPRRDIPPNPIFFLYAHFTSAPAVGEYDSVWLEEGGNIVASSGSAFRLTSGGGPSSGAVVRYLPDGKLDFIAANLGLNATAVPHPDGSIILAGQVFSSVERIFKSAAVARARIVPTYFATGADAGGGPNVQVFDAATGALVQSFFAYDPRFTGGVRVAIGDVTGDGVPDVVTAPGPGGGPDIRVYDSRTGALERQFLAFPPSFFGGEYLAVGDVSGDGFNDLVVSADAGGLPSVLVYDGKSLAADSPPTLYTAFNAYDPLFGGGVRVAVGDINDDLKDDIICGPGPGGGPILEVFAGHGRERYYAFAAFPLTFTGGIFVACGDFTGLGENEVMVSAGPGGWPEVQVYSPILWNQQKFDPLLSFLAYDIQFAGGVRIGTADRDHDGATEILCAAGPGGGPDVRAVKAKTEQGKLVARSIDDFFAYNLLFAAGLFVGGGGS